tara:strand:+ start:6753 stop:6956 length:204 start_codon:yes stop_codon:yes gene_type:complete
MKNIEEKKALLRKRLSEHTPKSLYAELKSYSKSAYTTNQPSALEFCHGSKRAKEIIKEKIENENKYA